MTLVLADGAMQHAIRVVPAGADGLRVEAQAFSATVEVARRERRLALADEDGRFDASVVRSAEDRLVFLRGSRRTLRFVDPLLHAGEEEAHAGHMMAPMSGAIVAVFAQPGERVAKGAPLIVLEAMKMEHTIVAPADGIVTAVNCAVGDRVAEGADLVDLDDAG
jgi:3-methylcrotonyl-CoA carboxylase alpha subunit